MRLARLLVALTVAVLVPLQGLAAMTAGVCMAMGHHDGAPSAAEHDHATAHEHGAHEGAAEHGSDSGEPSAHCAPCVACCAAACIPSAMSVSFPHPLPLAALGALPAAPPGFVPDSFDRPPLAL